MRVYLFEPMALSASRETRVSPNLFLRFSPDSPPTAFLAWKLEDVEYGDWTGGASADGVFHLSTTVPISERVQNNGSLFAHVFFVHAGNSPNPHDGDKYLRTGTAHKTVMINKYKKKRFVNLRGSLERFTKSKSSMNVLYI